LHEAQLSLTPGNLSQLLVNNNFIAPSPVITNLRLIC